MPVSIHTRPEERVKPHLIHHHVLRTVSIHTRPEERVKRSLSTHSSEADMFQSTPAPKSG